MKPVIFDVGGVLIDYQRDTILAAIAANCRAETAAESVVKIMTELDLCSGHNTVHDFFRELAEQLGFGGSKEKLLECWVSGLHKRDWVADLLSDLSERSELYILSDTNDGHWAHIATHLLDLHHFERVFLSHELLMRKTSRPVFQHVLAEIQHPADQCLFIDDTFSNTDTAHSCGFQTHHYQERHKMIAAISSHLS